MALAQRHTFRRLCLFLGRGKPNGGLDFGDTIRTNVPLISSQELPEELRASDTRYSSIQNRSSSSFGVQRNSGFEARPQTQLASLVPRT